MDHLSISADQRTIRGRFKGRILDQARVLVKASASEQ
jgi:hypothetical protein